MTQPLAVAVIGTGSLGKEHARVYAELAREGHIRLVGVHDEITETARRVAERHGVPVLPSLDAAIAVADAVSIVTPTSTHFDVARAFLGAGRDVLVEKPMCDHADQAVELVRLAKERKCIFQVGHIERFNPVFATLQKVAMGPRFIECHRLSPYPARSTDIGVVLDLMIHDLDVLLAFVRSPIESIDAVGIPVLSRSEDIANARIRFRNGCVANLTASRISPERMRKIRVFSGEPTVSYISLDYRSQEGFIYRLARDGEEESSLLRKLLATQDSTVVSEFAGKRIVREPVPITREEPLRLELQHFVECAKARRTPLVSGESAIMALDVAFEITRQIQAANPDTAPSPAPA